jgi:curved DNA-binding protein CbpA|tara:strand:+ start:196 stop:534 length:339 start_codon:yes stop_codon:yes gene_type:complete
MRTYYNILGVDHKASEQDITDAFLKLAINKTKIKELAEAYEILIDPIKRHQYDKEYLFKLNINFTDPIVVYNSVINKNNKIFRYFVNKQHLYNDYSIQDNVSSSHVLCKFNW